MTVVSRCLKFVPHYCKVLVLWYTYSVKYLRKPKFGIHELGLKFLPKYKF